MNKIFLYIAWISLIVLAIFLFLKGEHYFPRELNQKEEMSEGESLFGLKNIISDTSESFSEIKRVTKMYNASKNLNPDVVLKNIDDNYWYENKNINYSFLFDKNIFLDINKAEIFETIDKDFNIFMVNYEDDNDIKIRLAINERSLGNEKCLTESLFNSWSEEIMENKFVCQSEEDEEGFLTRECFISKNDLCYEIYYAINTKDNKLVYNEVEIESKETLAMMLKNISFK